MTTNQDLPYKRRPSVLEKPCEKVYCVYGAECLVDELTQQAYCRCDESCSDLFAPVCGSDRVTYSNECQLRLASCTQQRRIFVHNQGQCDMKDPCEDKECHFGAKCRSSLDGRTAECVCPEECINYIDGRSSRPVCGTDGRDYPNMCELKRTSCKEMRTLDVRFKGRCDPCEGVECPNSQICQLDDNRNPICRCNAICPDEVRPVCGSDGKSYSNECALRVEACKTRKNIRVVYPGECSAGKNPCENLHCSIGQECEIDKYGIASCQCPPKCESVMRPVCGTDGHTYYNECELHRTACLQKRTVAVSYSGQCGDTGPCHNYRCSFEAVCVLKNGQPGCECPTCSEEFEPVCGNDGMSYPNECKMRREACTQRKDIIIAYTGLCNTCNQKQCEYYAVCELDSKGKPVCVCPQTCVKIEAKICGNDGVTYQNECELRVSACTKKEFIIVASKGPCDLCIGVHCKYSARCEDGRCVCPTDCPENYEPVCGSDGVTYQNDCEMRRAACVQTQELTVLFYGECVDAQNSGSESTDSGSGGFACEEETCRFGGICDYDSEGFPHCICTFDCPAVKEPICASDGKFYDNECKMKEEACRQQKKIHIALKNKCQKRIDIPCDGEKPLINPVTGDDYFCGKGPNSKNCPPNSYCHKTTEFAKCCREVVLIKSCADTIHGCCPDGKTSAQGPSQAGCPSVCNCNRLGSYSISCDPSNLQCPCKPGVGGLRCDRCEPGFWGLHKISDGTSGCSPCACNLYGSVRDDCEQMTGRCVCKHGIQGMKCDICPKGMVLGPDGCVDASIANAVSGSCEQLQCFHGAQCKENDKEAQCVCDFKCATENRKDTVCGSDGNTYGSECQLSLFSCRYQKPIAVLHEGPCKKVGTTADTSTEFPTTTISPVRRSTELRSTVEPDIKQAREVTDNLSENLFYTARSTFITTTPVTESGIGMPMFSGNSYLELPRIHAYSRLSVEIEFKTLTTDGIVLYSGQTPSGYGDFIAITIKDSSVEFRYNLGNGPIVLRSPQKLQLGKFHRVIAKRYLREGMLSVDGINEVLGESPGNRNSLDLAENLFLGFVPSASSQIFENTGIAAGFVGCIRHLKIGRRAVDIRVSGSEVIKAEEIRECSDDDCSSMPCQHGASCMTSSNGGYTCICPENFSGRNCEILRNPCAIEPCAYGATCMAEDEDKFSCICPEGSFGDLCEEVETLEEEEELTVDFKGDSYLEFPTLNNVAKSFTIEMWFLARSLNGLLLHNGQKPSGEGDFVAVTLLNGFLHLIYNLGSGTANISSSDPITLSIWHSVKVSRIKRKGTLQIDNGPIISGESKPALSELNLEQPLYIGGIPDFTILNEKVSVQTGLDGAIQRIVINGETWDDLANEAITRYKVQQYVGPPCLPDTCANDGRCLPLMDEFQCQCSGNYTGDRCEELITTEINDLVSHQPVALDGKTFMKFSGRRRGEKLKGQRDNHFELIFRTKSSDGLLLWTNRGPTIRGDYLALAIASGKVHLSFNLGKQIEPMVIESVEKVNDNSWHRVVVKRNRRLGILIVDGHPPVTNTSEPGATELNTDGFLWIGGSTSVPPGFPAAYYKGFTGCISSALADGESLHLTSLGSGRHMEHCQPS